MYFYVTMLFQKINNGKNQIVEREIQQSLTSAHTTLFWRTDPDDWPKYQIKWRRNPILVINNNCVPLEMRKFLSNLHDSLKCVAKNMLMCS